VHVIVHVMVYFCHAWYWRGHPSSTSVGVNVSLVFKTSHTSLLGGWYNKGSTTRLHISKV